MAKSIDQLADLGRPVITGDQFVVEAALGAGTKRVGADKVAGKGAMKPPHFFDAVGGETEVTVPDFETSTWSLVTLSGRPLRPYNGALPVPGGHYKPDQAQSRILLGDAMLGGEEIVILHY